MYTVAIGKITRKSNRSIYMSFYFVVLETIPFTSIQIYRMVVSSSHTCHMLFTLIFQNNSI